MYEAAGLELTKARGFPRVRAEALSKHAGARFCQGLVFLNYILRFPTTFFKTLVFL